MSDAWRAFLQSLDALEIEHAFERAIRDAVLVEREACAQVAESFIPSGFRDGTRGGELFGIARDDRARTIAAAIRARAAQARGGEGE